MFLKTKKYIVASNHEGVLLYDHMTERITDSGTNTMFDRQYVRGGMVSLAGMVI